MNLRLGTPLQMEQEAVSGKTQHAVRFVGYLPGVSFMATVPIYEDKPIWMRQGLPVTFRVLGETHVYAFSTAVLRARSRPSSYAHFALPAGVRCRSIRRHPRAGVRLPVEIRRPDATCSMAILHDLSLRGATLEMVGLLACIGETIHLELPLILPEVVKKLSLVAVVRNASDFESSVEKGRFRYGIEFVEVADEDSLLLHYFIDHAIAELHARC